MQILVIEDDKRISDFLTKGLEEHAYSVTLCTNAEDAIAYYLNLPWNLMLVDVMLPGIDGIQLVQIIRHKKIHVPILMLSALGTVQDKVSALDYGADDYITKPFHFEELLSRIRALTRRYQSEAPEEKSNKVYFNNLHIDFDQFQVFLSDTPVELSPREFKLLLYLTENSNKAVSRMQILNAVWGINFDNQTNVVDVYISYLRNKIEKSGDKFIHTVKGIGYMFKI
ncbi:response regulator transcription factor [Sphingobacterium pedocola]|uniref:DNA-binding response regulator n=1 Tax=Sphingobacterium pedocola TaxID=2082722 RepID=A0ABR9T9X9_9SPHI|nr:response regulator transcription factor [Sphingobacterium pedocola]MBE8722095.1 DNA-binding response regulator [Sphingobacterium pedocola]